jgi:hypothetical protein
MFSVSFDVFGLKYKFYNKYWEKKLAKISTLYILSTKNDEFGKIPDSQ